MEKLEDLSQNELKELWQQLQSMTQEETRDCGDIAKGHTNSCLIKEPAVNVGWENYWKQRRRKSASNGKRSLFYSDKNNRFLETHCLRGFRESGNLRTFVCQRFEELADFLA